MPRDAYQPRGARPWCGTCDTDRHLVVDSLTVLNRRQETLAAAFTCRNCSSSRVLATIACYVPVILARSALESRDVLHGDCQPVVRPEARSGRGAGAADGEKRVPAFLLPAAFLALCHRAAARRLPWSFQRQILKNTPPAQLQPTAQAQGDTIT